MDDSGHEDITISDIDSYDFQWEIILYALHPDRLLFIDNMESWKDFRNENQVNSKKHEEKPEQLCEHFLYQLLPKINKYDLNEKEETLLSLLDLHPGYRRTEDGFVKTDEMEIIGLRRDCGVMLANNQQNDNTSGDLLLANPKDLNCQVVITQHDAEQHSDKKLSKENASLLSVALCSNADLPLCQLLAMDAIKKRFQEAKILFGRSGQLMDNIKCPVEDLIAKLKSLCELKETIAELVHKQF